MSTITYTLRVKVDGHDHMVTENDTTVGLIEDINLVSELPGEALIDIEAWVDEKLVFAAEADDVKDSVNMDKLIALAELAVEKEISEP